MTFGQALQGLDDVLYRRLSREYEEDACQNIPARAGKSPEEVGAFQDKETRIVISLDENNAPGQVFPSGRVTS
jgi:hypothetical protein